MSMCLATKHVLGLQQNEETGQITIQLVNHVLQMRNVGGALMRQVRKICHNDNKVDSERVSMISGKSKEGIPNRFGVLLTLITKHGGTCHGNS